MKNLILCLFVVLSGPLALAQSKTEARIPADAKALIARIQSCIHFSGEEPYNDERKAEIAKALKESRCDSLDEDTVKIKRKYRKSPAIIKAIEAEESGDN